jgi:AbrB family looped-hinge helix DNA binding protein
MQAFTAQLEKSGRILIPAPVRRKLGLREGSLIIVKVNEKGGLDVESRSQALARVQSKLRKYIPEGALVSDQLIADRRSEAARENRKSGKSTRK